ncbi:hypothetical protein [Desulfotomaculum sp. 1211_IL3151]|uniref:hypothetical protein n=1 Tax=Desulfotomaculum sp. 1211_IL3151 TaxID=3084055 RepID=UPI002FD91A07
MSGKDFNFDQQMIDQLSDVTPPEEEIRKINPWSKPIGFITWGFILTTLRLDFLYLQYILPTIGVMLIFIGFRSLRNENKYFKIAWILSILKLFLQLGDLVLVSTPLNIVGYREIAIGTVMLAFQIAMFLVFRAALQETSQKAGRLMEGNPLLWASLWTVAAFLIALFPLPESWLIFIPMVICYIFIVRSLYLIGGQLDDTGYILTNAPIRISNRTFGWTYFLVALTTVIICSTFYNHLQLEQQEYYLPETTEVRQHLLDMEFPAEALRYLSNEDVSRLSDAVNVESFSKLLMFDAKRVEHRESFGGHTQITHTYKPGKKNIEATTVYIEMPENVVYVMQYFTWKGGRPIWQDGILISGETEADDKQVISSSLFYSKRGTEYTADFPRIVCDKMTKNTMFGTYYPVLITGALSYPFDSEDQGGYVLYRYTVRVDSNIYATHATLSYVHLLSPLHIPYTKTEDLILSGAYTFEDRLQQHYTNYESLAFREIDR